MALSLRVPCKCFTRGPGPRPGGPGGRGGRPTLEALVTAAVPAGGRPTRGRCHRTQGFPGRVTSDDFESLADHSWIQWFVPTLWFELEARPGAWAWVWVPAGPGDKTGPASACQWAPAGPGRAGGPRPWPGSLKAARPGPGRGVRPWLVTRTVELEAWARRRSGLAARRSTEVSFRLTRSLSASLAAPAGPGGLSHCASLPQCRGHSPWLAGSGWPWAVAVARSESRSPPFQDCATVLQCVSDCHGHQQTNP